MRSLVLALFGVGCFLASSAQSDSLVYYIRKGEDALGSGQTLVAYNNTGNDVPRVPAGEDLVQNRLQLCIGELPERKQRVIRMLYYEELSPQAVADRLTIERNNVNKLAHDARLKLRECLKRHGFGSSEDVLEM